MPISASANSRKPIAATNHRTGWKIISHESEWAFRYQLLAA
jgi:hypothetical protein